MPEDLFAVVLLAHSGSNWPTNEQSERKNPTIEGDSKLREEGLSRKNPVS
jgi:hypothetical protein